MGALSRIGLFTLHDKTTTNVEGPGYVRSLGLNAFELYSGKDLATPDPAVARRVREEAEKHNVTLPCLSASFNLCGEKGKWAAELLMRYAECAREAGVPLLHHTLYRELNPDAWLPSYEDAVEELVPRVREIYDYAASLGVQCVYEDQGHVINGVERFGGFLKALDRPAGVVLDLGNTVFAGETADAFAAAFGDRVVHVHVKDFCVRPYDEPGSGCKYRLKNGLGASPAILGEGDTRMLDALEILHRHEYKGYYMLECDAIRDARAEFPEHYRVLCSAIGDRP